ncbi:unnamed protein product [Brassica rapa subsp. narinosa]
MRKACSVSKIDVRSGRFSFTKKTPSRSGREVYEHQVSRR